ncbi:MAG: sodium:solute symporter family protein [bacterium]
MQLATLDWIVIGFYGLVTFVLGIWFTRRASRSLEDYFVAGRSLTWWIAGTSIAATWFATDAPLAAASLVRQNGIFGNWLWWYETGGLMLLVFFFAKFWRRANILTDAEFMEIRYSGKSATTLRVIAALYHGVVRNCIVMGWVMLAMVKFAQVLLGWDAAFTLLVCGFLAVFYTVASGLWGVVVTDLFQFVTGLTGSIILAAIVLIHLGGPSDMVAAISNLQDGPKGALDILPNPENISPLQFISYLCLIFVLWSRSGHDGYPAQRLFATKNDKNAMLAAFWWGFLGITIMTWPWIIVGLGSLVMFPISEAVPALAADPELAYPMMLAKLMPVGLKGLLVASFLAAFMSTMDTHLCWGGSYLVNDIYKRFLKKNAPQAHYVSASRISILILVGFAMVTAYFMESIESAWIYIIDLTAGMAIVWALRWYWWRVNAWAEISAMLGSLVFANGGLILSLLESIGVISGGTVASLGTIYTDEYNLIRAGIILVICTGIWIMVAFVTKPDSQEVLENFYVKVRPGGWWGAIAEKHPEIQTDVSGGQRWIGWIMGVAFIYSSLLGIGYFVTAHYLWGVVLVIMSAGALVGTLYFFRLSKSPSDKLGNFSHIGRQNY